MSSPVITDIPDASRSIVVAVLVTLVIGSAAWTGATLVIVGAVVLAAVIGLWVPAGVLGAVVLTLPWFYQPIQIGSQRFAASELLLAAACAAVVGRVMLEIARTRRRVLTAIGDRFEWVVSSPVVWAVAGIALVGFVLALFPYDPTHRAESLREWRWVFLEPLLLVGLLSFAGRQRSLAAVMLALLLIGGTLATIQALYEAISVGALGANGVVRISGPYLHPNALALFLSRVVAVGLAWFVVRRAGRPLIAPLVAVTVAGLVGSFSRGAFIAIFAVVVLLLIPAVPRVRVAGLSFIAAAVAALLIVARGRILDLFGGGSGSLRLDIWSSALEMIRDRPILGYGPDQFLYAYAPRYIEPTAWGERFTAHAHNLFFDFWLRLGIIGAAFVLVVVGFWAHRIVRAFRSTHQLHHLPTVGLIGLLAVFVHGLVDNAYFSHDLAMSFWLLAWIAFGSERLSVRQGVQRIASSRYRWRRIHRVAPVRHPAR